jgi:hypothetical protein
MESNKEPEVFVVASEKKPRKRRDRTEYMRQYYQKHKEAVSCPNCLKEFACVRSLRHHQDRNMHCLVSRLDNILGLVKDEYPEEMLKVEPLLQDELNRIRKLSKDKNISVETEG